MSTLKIVFFFLFFIDIRKIVWYNKKQKER
nr:MAG TPA: hypothetical protein [Caudoviricetes sp.]